MLLAMSFFFSGFRLVSHYIVDAVKEVVIYLIDNTLSMSWPSMVTVDVRCGVAKVDLVSRFHQKGNALSNGQQRDQSDRDFLECVVLPHTTSPNIRPDRCTENSQSNRRTRLHSDTVNGRIHRFRSNNHVLKVKLQQINFNYYCVVDCEKHLSTFH
jgi:hypothetical protein